MPRLFHGAVVGIALAVASTSAVGQSETDFYYHEGNLVGVVIRLDTIGIVARPDSSEAVDAAVAPYGLTLANVIGHELRLYALRSWVPRDSLFRLTEGIELDLSAIVATAGPFLRTVAGRFGLATTSQLIVQFRPTVPTSSIDSLDGVLGLLVAAKTPFKPNHYLLHRGPRSTSDVLQLAQQLSIHPLVEYAYPNFVDASALAGAGGPGRAPSHAAPRPPAPVPWHLSNDGSTGGTPNADIQAADAWTIEPGKTATVIAVIENGGFDITHPDLTANLWNNPGELGGDEDGNGFSGDKHGWNFQTCGSGPLVTSAADPGLSQPCGMPELADPSPDPNTHGTAVAGLAAGASGNSIGASGVCPKCSLMLVRTGGLVYGRYLAFLYAATEGAHVINASWTSGVKDPVKWAMEEAASVYDVPIVMSVHHDTGIDDPEACTGANQRLTSMPEVIAVVATDDDDKRIDKTGYGPCVGLAAPGGRKGIPVGITTTDVIGSPGYNKDNPTSGCADFATNLNYTQCFGWTSAAAPLVSGTIGLMLSKDPTLTRQQVTAILYATAEKVGSLAYTGGFNEFYGHGRVNAFCALGGTGPRCPAGPGDGAGGGTGGGTQVTPTGGGAFELGVRMGITARTDAGGTTTVTNVPGSGPLALPVLYVDWFPISPIMIDLQAGGQFVTNSGGSAEAQLGGAIQPNFLLPVGFGQVFVGPNLAGEARKTGGAWSNDWALGLGVGYRLKLKPYFAMRLEGRYRYWNGQHIDEYGVAMGFGVVLN